MNSEIKQKWIQALISGEYKQGKYHLKKHYRQEIQHCCLGVLCEVTHPDYFESVKSEEDDPKNQECFAFAWKYENKNVVESLPDKFMKKIGLSYYQQDHLITMNDDENNSFEEIAEYIKKNL